MTSRIALGEQETNYTVEATDRSVVHVFSNDLVIWKQMERLGIEPYRSDEYGRFYDVSMDEFNFGIRRKRQLSEGQRQVLRERMKAMHGD